MNSKKVWDFYSICQAGCTPCCVGALCHVVSLPLHYQCTVWQVPTLLYPGLAGVGSRSQRKERDPRDSRSSSKRVMWEQCPDQEPSSHSLTPQRSYAALRPLVGQSCLIGKTVGMSPLSYTIMPIRILQ